jgi:hypothetical protein
LIVAVDGEKLPFSVTPNTLTTVVRIGSDKNRLLRSRPFQRRIFPKNLRAVQLLPGHTKLEGTVTDPGSEIDDAQEISGHTDICRSACPRSRRAGAKGAK